MLWPSSLVLRNVLVGKLNTWARRENYVIVIKGWEIVTTFEFKERKKDIPEHRDMMKLAFLNLGHFLSCCTFITVHSMLIDCQIRLVHKLTTHPLEANACG